MPTTPRTKTIARSISTSHTDHLTAEEQLLLNQMREALAIYQK
jgi:hypothetical protein